MLDPTKKMAKKTQTKAISHPDQLFQPGTTKVKIGLGRDGNKIGGNGFVAHKKNADGSYTSATINVLVASQAIQADGFDAATDALNSGFGSNPWA